MWKKGESGNPGGRSKDHKKLKEIITLECQAKSGGSCALYFVRKLMDFIEYADSHKTKLEAVRLLMAYRYGNPSNTIEIDSDGEIQKIIITGVPEPLIVVDRDQDPPPTDNGTDHN